MRLPNKGMCHFKNVNLENLPDWQLGWLAGMLDGEGSIIISGMGRPKVTIASTTPVGEVVKWMVGFGSAVSYSRTNAKWKDIHYWEETSVMGIYILLSKLSFYLLIKSKQCNLMLEYCKGRLSGDLDKPREWYRDEMQELNKRGK